MGFFRWLWGLSGTIWKYSATEHRWASVSGTLWTFLFLLFFLFFAVAWIFGYPPSEVSAWLDAHAALWNLIGGWLWRGFWGLVLLVCGISVFGIGMDLFGERTAEFKNEPRDFKGNGCMLLAIVVVCYFAWIAITMPLD